MASWIENIHAGPEKATRDLPRPHVPEKNVRFFDVITFYDLVLHMFSRKTNSECSRFL